MIIGIICSGQGSGPVLSSGDMTNMFILFTNTTILQIGCADTQTATLREVLRYKFRACSGSENYYFIIIVIAATDIFRKKNKFQWTKNFMAVLTSRDILLFENDKYII